MSQIQQASLQTVISQNPVRNFPSGSHLSLWWIVAAELWSVRAEKFWFFLSCIRSCPTVAVWLKYWWQLSAGGHTEILAVRVIWVTTCYFTYWKAAHPWGRAEEVICKTLWCLQLSSTAVSVFMLHFPEKHLSIKNDVDVVFCFPSYFSWLILKFLWVVAMFAEFLRLSNFSVSSLPSSHFLYNQAICKLLKNKTKQNKKKLTNWHIVSHLFPVTLQQDQENVST